MWYRWCACLVVVILIVTDPRPVSAQSSFIRGDVNADGTVNLGDVATLFAQLFRGGSVECLLALDVDASGSVNVADPIALLRHLFLFDVPPSAPFPDCGVVSGSSLGCEIHAYCDLQPDPVSAEKELFITDLTVVEEPCRTRWGTGGCDPRVEGAWTFGKLMASLAGLSTIDEDPGALSRFVLGWLEQIRDDQVINGFLVKGRSGMASFIADWAETSGFADPTDPDLVLDMRIAPFRLLSIVCRLDLREPGDAGEGRFVFGFLNSNSLGGSDVRLATVIFEYKLPAKTPADVLRWAERWHALGALPFGEEYFVALHEITNDFAGVAANPGAPNGSALAQLRTNEIAFGSPWELREFKLLDTTTPSGTASLMARPVAQTVDLNHTGSQRLADFLASVEGEVLKGTHHIPLQFDGKPLQAGSALLPGSFSWGVPGFDCTETRHVFALNTCNGCHGAETNTGFVHVTPRLSGQETVLSRFLVGSSSGIPDPSCPPPGTERDFNDLLRRAADLTDLLQLAGTMDVPADMLFATSNRAKRVH